MSNQRTSFTASSTFSNVSRRKFLATAGAAASWSVLKPNLTHGYAANSKVKIGLIGCGGRGSWIADLFQQHGGYELVAVADYFQDRADAAEELQVPEAQRFTGLAGYERLLEQSLDAVVIESPPFFHPQQARRAVEAGKHVYLAKPIAVDVPGCQSVDESGRKATQNGLCFLVDFQTRADEFFVEALQRVHAGAIGRFAFGESTYHADIPWLGQLQYVREGQDNPESRLRWGLDRELSGDIITEQNIHTIDVASWIMGQAPVAAYGTGGRKLRDVGTCWDTFSVTFQYPENVGIAFSSRQFQGHGTQPDGIRNRMFGTDGVLETAYGGDVLIRGKNFWRGGKSPGIYKDGAVNNIATFHASIQSGDHSNPTVAESVRSNLVTILGRTAAYRGEVVTWESLMKDGQPFTPDLKGLKS